MLDQLHGIGRWVDACLQELLLFCKKFITYSDDTLRVLREFKRVCEDYFVTTYDAEAMHPNIRTEVCFDFMLVALDSFVFKVKPS